SGARRPVMATENPSRQSASAKARPMPVPPPVIQATLMTLLGNLHDKADVFQHHRHRLAALAVARIDHRFSFVMNDAGHFLAPLIADTNRLHELPGDGVKGMAVAVKEDRAPRKAAGRAVGRIFLLAGLMNDAGSHRVRKRSGLKTPGAAPHKGRCRRRSKGSASARCPLPLGSGTPVRSSAPAASRASLSSRIR